MAKTPEMSHTISELIENGNNSTLTYDKFCIYEKLNDELYVPFKNILNDYLDDLKGLSLVVELSNSEYNKYLYKPRLLAYDIYGSTDLYYVILAINNIFNEKQFNLRKLRMLKKDVLVEALSQIYNSEKGFIEARNAKAETEGNKNTMNNQNEVKSFSQQLIDKYPDTWDAVSTPEIVEVYPFYATTVDGTLTKQPLVSGKVFTVTFATETDFKQAIKIKTSIGQLKKIEQYNDLSKEWEVIANNTFSISIDLDYTIYTHVGSLIGSRRVRFTME